MFLRQHCRDRQRSAPAAVLKFVAIVTSIASPLALVHHGIPVVSGFGHTSHPAFRVRPQALGFRAPTPPAYARGSFRRNSVSIEAISRHPLRAWLTPSVLVVLSFGYIGGRRRCCSRAFGLGSWAVTA